MCVCFAGPPLNWTSLVLLDPSRKVNQHAAHTFGETERRWFAARNEWDLRLYEQVRREMLGALPVNDAVPTRPEPTPPAVLDVPLLVPNAPSPSPAAQLSVASSSHLVLARSVGSTSTPRLDVRAATGFRTRCHPGSAP